MSEKNSGFFHFFRKDRNTNTDETPMDSKTGNPQEQKQNAEQISLQEQKQNMEMISAQEQKQHTEQISAREQKQHTEQVSPQDLEGSGDIQADQDSLADAQTGKESGEAAALQKKPRVFASTSDSLQALFNIWLMETDQDDMSEEVYEYMVRTAYRVENAGQYNFEVNVKRFFMQARILTKKRLNDYTMATKKAALGEEEPEYSADAEPVFYIAPDSMLLLTMVLPPIGSGAHIQPGQIKAYLQEAGIKNGVLDSMIQKIVDEKSYFIIYPLALGTLAFPGKDGEIIDRMPREADLSYNENDMGNIDFTSRNFLKEVSKGDIICDIIPPTKGTEGKDILGRVLAAKEGRNAYVPQGKNTMISEDGTALLAATDGYITFRNGTFRVIEVLDIQGNVDFSVGNIKHHGGVVIHGDVLNGFEIQAEGDVVVYGVVEAAKIVSGGDIIIHNGMNGNFEGELNAAGEIRSPFLENTLVSAGKDIHTGSIICCDVFCDGTIYANSKMGIVIGGSLTAMNTIKARIIGNKAGRKTELTLGTLPHVVREKEDLEQNAKDLDESMALLKKNISYLKGIENLPEQKQQVLKQLEEQYRLYGEKKESLQRRSDTISQQLNLVDEAAIECNTIYPVTTITISGVSTKITEVTKNARIALTETGEIAVFPLK